MMGNLGPYQDMVVLAKRLGGPKALAAVVAVAGYVAIRPAEAAVQHVVHTIKKRTVPFPTKGRIFVATSDGEDVSGLTIRAGDEYRVLEGDNDAVLIEVIGNTDNPYLVSREFLTSISDFPAGDDEGSQ